MVKPLENVRFEDGNDVGSGDGQGVADRVLREREEERGRGTGGGNGGSVNGDGEGRDRRRSMSSSAESIATISTSDDRDQSPASRRRPFDDRTNRKHGDAPTRSPRKRRYSSVSSTSSASRDRSPKQPGFHRKNRRHRTISPDDRGRPHSYRRGSRRSRSGSAGKSMDKSQITKQRRVFEDQEDDEVFDDDRDGRRYRSRRGQNDGSERKSGDRLDRRGNDALGFDGRGSDADLRRNGVGSGGGGSGRGREQQARGRKERSLSPYSRRLALTQAMNNMER